MKNVLFVVVLLCCSSLCAQLAKGNIVLGGSHRATIHNMIDRILPTGITC